MDSATASASSGCRTCPGEKLHPDWCFVFYASLPLLASVLFNAAYNSAFLRIWAESSFFLTSQKALITHLMVYSLFLILTLNRILFAVLLPALVLLTSITAHFMHHYQILEMSSQSLAFALESNIEEALGFIGQDLISSMAVCLVVSVPLVLLFVRNSIPCAPTGKKLGLIALSAAICVTWSIKTEFPTPLPLPFSLFEAGADYAWQDHLFRSLSEMRKNFPVEATYRSDKEMVLVLIIGEAARPGHFHVNGYTRQTTPRIEQLGMLSFRDVTACGDSTRVSVPCMLTRATSRDLGRAFREPSLISVFKKAGFHTAWISNQRVRGGNDTPVTVIAREAEFLHFGNPRGDFTHIKLLDEDLLPALDEALDHPAPRKLIVLHTVGSHWFYEQHYSDDFRKFTPVCEKKEPRKCTGRELVSSYDNTIAYTDHFIASVAERVSGFRSLVIYVSDHGESLGECGRFSHGHGQEYPEQMEVPMLVWTSGEFSSTDPEKVAALARNTAKSTSHDILFHSLLDCASIASPMLDGNMSVCR